MGSIQLYLPMIVLVIFCIDKVANAAIITDRTSKTCGYQSCNPVKDDMLNVHIVPHTHDDVGWTKTYKQYYDDAVHKIITSVVNELKQDAANGGHKKFIYVEMAFMKLWWTEQTMSVKNVVKDLINEGRLEIILGGWCMNDEATPYYADIIDQHTLGFEFIRLNFGDCARPKIGWQIDPFGHSREVASLFAQFGFDGMFVGRIDYQDKEVRENSKTMEMVWSASDTLGESSDLFVGVLANVYWPPKGFCWDYWCSDREIVYEADEFKKIRVKEFVEIMKLEASHYDTNHIMVEMGSDFHYQVANKWFENLDTLIDTATKMQDEDSDFKVNLLYSTPSCYLDQLHRANKTWTTKKDDFFPYAHRAHSFWTGYFTSRPNLKRLVRTAGAVLNTCKQLNALSLLQQEDGDINYLKEAMAVVQHHDGVSGTEKQHVAEDYTRLLMNGINYCHTVIQNTFNKLLPIQDEIKAPKMYFCNNLELDTCKTTENNDQFVVTVYNPLVTAYKHHCRIPVSTLEEYEILDHDGKLIEHQVLEISDETKAIPERFSSESEQELIFTADLPPLGFTTFFISKVVQEAKDVDDVEWLEERIIEIAEEGIDPVPSNTAVEIIENQYYTVTVDKDSGLISRIWNKKEDIAIALSQNFFYYEGHSGSNYNADYQASGAYIFRPTKDTPTPVDPRKVEVITHKGGQVHEIRQVFCPWVSQVIRLYDNESHIELEWTVGPLPQGIGGWQGRNGKEVITKYMTDMPTNGEMYTDLNGRETLKRKRDSRDTWTLRQSEEVAGNYYPITSRAAIKDEERNIQLTVLVDRAEGVGSIQDGNLEIMVHRRTFYDDSLGVGEPLREDGINGQGIVARGKHYIMLNKGPNAASIYRPLYQKIYLPPHIAVATDNADYTDWKHLYQTRWTGVQVNLPLNVHLLTLDHWPSPVVKIDDDHTAYLIRLEHIFEKHEGPKWASPATVYLKRLFKPFRVISIIELSLGANMKKSEMNRMKWKTKDDASSRYSTRPADIDDDLDVIELSPMEIRTFQVNVKIIQ